jgi:hypothetical protein
VFFQVKSGGDQNSRKLADAKKLELAKKTDKEDTLSLLFKPVATQKIEKG